jgi:hypothetical protein
MVAQSMIIVPIGSIAIMLIGYLVAYFKKDYRYGAYPLLFAIGILLIWGLWLGYYHLVPSGQVNNMCPASDQVSGYCR